MAYVPAVKVADRLFNLNLRFVNNMFTGKVDYVRKHLNEYEGGTREAVMEAYEDLAQEYIMLATELHLEKGFLNMMTDIAELEVLYAVYNYISDAEKMLRAEGTSKAYSVPVSDEKFFEQFTLLAFRHPI